MHELSKYAGYSWSHALSPSTSQAVGSCRQRYRLPSPIYRVIMVLWSSRLLRSHQGPQSSKLPQNPHALLSSLVISLTRSASCFQQVGTSYYMITFPVVLRVLIMHTRILVPPFSPYRSQRQDGHHLLMLDARGQLCTQFLSSLRVESNITSVLYRSLNYHLLYQYIFTYTPNHILQALIPTRLLKSA
jgi:hypothetical protein